MPVFLTIEDTNAILYVVSCVCDLGPGVHGGPTRHDGTHGRVGPQSEVGLVVAEALPAAAATQVPSGCHTQGACLCLCVHCVQQVGPVNACLAGYPFLFFFFCVRVRQTYLGGRGKQEEGSAPCTLALLAFNNEHELISKRACVCVCVVGWLVGVGTGRGSPPRLPAAVNTNRLWQKGAY